MSDVRPSEDGATVLVGLGGRDYAFSKDEAMAFAAKLIEAATGYEVIHDGDEPLHYLRAVPAPRIAEMRLYAKDPACEGPPVRFKHDGCGGGLVVSEMNDEYTCRKCRVVISRQECRKRRALGEPGGYAPEESEAANG